MSLLRGVMVKQELTRRQREIYGQLIDQGLSVVRIAQNRGVSKQAVYAQLRIMVAKGWLRKEYSANYVGVD